MTRGNYHRFGTDLVLHRVDNGLAFNEWAVSSLEVTFTVTPTLSISLMISLNSALLLAT